MPRMFAEAQVVSSSSLRDTVQRLMRELDDVAAREGHRVVGEVTILEGQRSRLDIGRTVRVEADVEVAV